MSTMIALMPGRSGLGRETVDRGQGRSYKNPSRASNGNFLV